MLAKFQILTLVLLISISGMGQAGIYSESDIELQDLFIEAQLQKQLNNTEKQIELLNEVIKRNRNEDAAYFELAKVYFHLKDYSLAEKNASKAHGLKPDNVWYVNLLIEIYEESEQFAKAITSITLLIDLQRDNDLHVEKLAYLQLKNGQRDEAIKTLLSLQSKNGVEENISKKLFDIYHLSGQSEKALNTLVELSNAFPYNTRFLNNIAGYLRDLGQEKESDVYYQRVIELEPNNPTAQLALNKTTHKNIDALSGIEELINNENIELDDIILSLMPFISNMSRSGAQTDKLILLSQQLVDRFPNEVKALAVRADILFYSGEINESEKLYAKSVELDDTKYSLWDQWINNLWELQDFKKMYSVSSKAVDLFPNQISALLLNCLSAKKMNKLSEIQYLIEESKWIAGNNQQFLDAITVFSSWCNDDFHKQKDASQIIKNINANHFINPIYFELIGDLYLRNGDADNCKKYWNHAISMGASQSRISQKLGTLN